MQARDTLHVMCSYRQRGTAFERCIRYFTFRCGMHINFCLGLDGGHHASMHAFVALASYCWPGRF
jgi:hypothetical protein